MSYLALARSVPTEDERNEMDEKSPAGGRAEHRDHAALTFAPFLRVGEPITATTPPAGWDGTLCGDCQWPDLCRVLGPRGPHLPVGPCPAWPADATGETPRSSYVPVSGRITGR